MGLREGADRGKREANERAYDRPLDGPIIKALEAHVATLKEQLAAAEGKAREEANALREHNATLKADIETLKGHLTSAETRASEESAKTARAIAAFESLAERLEAIAEARRPWWRRLVG
jgi:chromosome segregation ATPase